MNITDELDKDVVEQGELTRIDVSQSKDCGISTLSCHIFIK